MPPSSRIKPGRAEAFHAPEVVHFEPSESDHRWCTLGDRGHKEAVIAQTHVGGAGKKINSGSGTDIHGWERMGCSSTLLRISQSERTSCGLKPGDTSSLHARVIIT